jgi:hypothetical protein
MKTIGLILSIPLLAQIAVWGCSTSLNPSPENIAQAGELMAQAVVPWWLPIINFLASWGTFGAILVVILLFLLVKSGALES